MLLMARQRDEDVVVAKAGHSSGSARVLCCKVSEMEQKHTGCTDLFTLSLGSCVLLLLGHVLCC